MKLSTLPATRRCFLLCSAAAGAVACGQTTWPQSSDGGTQPDGASSEGGNAGACGRSVDTGFTVESVAVGSLRFYRQGAGTNGTFLFVGHDASGFFAFDGHCTHQPFMLNGTPNAQGQLTCTVHDSVFSATGVLLSPSTTGPSMQGSLPMYAVCFRGAGPTATILVNTSAQLADRTQRFPAP